MFAISINYKNVPTSVREHHALDGETALRMQQALKEAGITESVYLNTCNRCEMYGVGDSRIAAGIMSEYSGVNLSEMRGYALFYQGEPAISHLFRVTAGIESMVVGEDEILGQVRSAYESARKNGFADYTLHKIFQTALTSAKKVKTDTLLSKSSVSVATIAGDKCHKFKKGPKTVLVIGATGDTGRKLIKNLISYQDSKIYATVRSSHIMEEGVEMIPYEDRYAYVDQADVVVSATRSPHYTLTRANLEKKFLSSKPRLFVDLAVPRDIDEEIADLPDCSLITIDEIEELARKNNELKSAEVELAGEMIRESEEELLKVLAFHDFLPEFEQMKGKMQEDFTHFVFHYRDVASAEEFSSFLSVLRKMDQEGADSKE